MPLGDVLKNPFVRRALEAGEEQVGKAVGKLLSGEGLSGGLQTFVAGAAHARHTIEKGVAQALHAANLPSKDDVAALKRKLEELETMIDGLADRVGRGGGSGRGGE